MPGFFNSPRTSAIFLPVQLSTQGPEGKIIFQKIQPGLNQARMPTTKPPTQFLILESK